MPASPAWAHSHKLGQAYAVHPRDTLSPHTSQGCAVLAGTSYNRVATQMAGSKDPRSKDALVNPIKAS